MAKIADVLKDLHRKLGVTVDESEYSQIGDFDVPDTVFNPILDTHLENFGKNRAKSIHANYDSKFDGFKDEIGESRLLKVKNQQGEKKLDALKDAFREALDDAKKAQKNEDPEALTKANNKILALEAKLGEIETKYSGVDFDGLNRNIEKYKKKAFDTELIMKFKESDLSDDFKKGNRIKLKLADFDTIVQSNGYLLDYETGKVTDKDGVAVTKNRKDVTVDTLIEEAIGDDKKIGEQPPKTGERLATPPENTISTLQARANARYNAGM